MRVLARPAFSNRGVNPYNARIYTGIEAHGVRVREYDWRGLLIGADVVHVHWPESSFNHGWLGAKLTTEALLVGLGTARRRGAKVVWTMHNLRAHERRHPVSEASFWARFVPHLDAVIALSEASLARARRERDDLNHLPAFVVRHPHYRGAYRDDIDRAAARARLDIPLDKPVVAFFGHIKAYKNVPALVKTVLDMPETYLVVAGKARDRALADAVRGAAGTAKRVRLALEHVPDDEAQVFLRAADLIALPYVDILNSGTALLGLSFDRAVWLPDDGPARALAADLQTTVGPKWVHRGALTPASLQAALHDARALPERTEGAHLAAFSPAVITARTAEVLREVAGR